MLTTLLVTLYTTAAILLIYRIQKTKKISLSKTEVALSFSFKVVMGILYGYIFKKYYGGDDTWMHFNDSLLEYNKLLFQTGQFIKDLMPLHLFAQSPTFSKGLLVFIQNLEYEAMTKPLAVFNLFSAQNYYVNVVFFNFFVFWGQYLLFKLFTELWPEKRTLFFIAVFFIPPITFWISGIRADGWLMLFTAIILYYYHQWFEKRKIKQLAIVVTGLLGLIILRYPLFFLIIPALISWGISKYYSLSSWKTYTFVYAISAVIFFGSVLFSPTKNLPLIVVQKQQEFLQLKGNTVFVLHKLEPTLTSFIKTLPQAFTNTFLRPYLWETKGLLQWVTAIEVIAFWLFILYLLFKKSSFHYLQLVHFGLFFGVSLYLFIGYTIPFPGAIVRYRVIAELLIIVSIIASKESYYKKL